MKYKEIFLLKLSLLNHFDYSIMDELTLKQKFYTNAIIELFKI